MGQNEKNQSSKEYLELVSYKAAGGLSLNQIPSLRDYKTKEYHKGCVSGYKWCGEVIYYLLEKEQRLKDELLSILESKKEEMKTLKDGDFKSGVLNSIQEIIEHSREVRK